MSNGSPHSSGEACTNPYDQNGLVSFSGVGDLPVSDFEQIFGNFSLDLSGTVDLYGQGSPVPFVYPLLETGNTGLPSPPDSPAPHQQPYPEADFAGPNYGATLQNGTIQGDTSFTQQSFDFSAWNSVFALRSLDGNLDAQDAATGTLPYSNPSLESLPAESAQEFEAHTPNSHASTEHARAEPQPKPYRCEKLIDETEAPFGKKTCGKDFHRCKDLKRHDLSVHRQDDDPVYICCCDKETTRKDNHRRHVKACRKPRRRSKYGCKCSLQHALKKDHERHVKACSHGQGSRGRPSAS